MITKEEYALMAAAVYNDTLTGGAGNDVLQGGEGTDTYQFDAGWGKDVITDSDAQGSITIGGEPLGTAKGAGKTNVWVSELGAAGSGQFVGMAVFDDASSSTGKKLIITKGVDTSNTSNTIIINNFDLAAATGGQGYLGIKLDKTQHIARPQNTINLGAAYAYSALATGRFGIKNTDLRRVTTARSTVACVRTSRSKQMQLTYYQNRSCLRNDYAGYRPKIPVKAAR